MIKAVLFLSSLAPLAIVLAIRLSAENVLATALLSALSILAIIFLFVALKARHQTNAQPFKVASVKNESQQIPAYLLTYMFPFLFVSVGGWQDLLAYAAFALLLVVLLFRTDLVLVNPLLLVVGFHLYVVQTGTGNNIILVAKEQPVAGQSILAVRLSQTTYKLDHIQQ